MKKIFAFIAISFLLVSAAYAGYVNGYTRKDGTYVQGHNRSDPNDTVRDNYSYKGNVNPYTGEEGGNYNRNDASSEYYDGSSSNSTRY